MRLVLRTTNMVEISAASAFLRAEGIESFELDRHMSSTEGSIGIFPRRLMVREEDEARARELLTLAGIETSKI